MTPQSGGGIGGGGFKEQSSKNEYNYDLFLTYAWTDCQFSRLNPYHCKQKQSKKIIFVCELSID